MSGELPILRRGDGVDESGAPHAGRPDCAGRGVRLANSGVFDRTGNETRVSSSARKSARERRGLPVVTPFRSRLAALAAAVSLTVQLLAIPHHQALSAPTFATTDTRLVAADLKATFGDAAALCVQADDRGAPSAPAGDCDDHCPLCRFAAQAATLVAPDASALPVRFSAALQAFCGAPERDALPVWIEEQGRARAPPYAV